MNDAIDISIDKGWRDAWDVYKLPFRRSAPLAGLQHLGAAASYLVAVAASALTAPFYAHVLTVIYYRITDPEKPVIHPDVGTWRSVWEGR